MRDGSPRGGDSCCGGAGRRIPRKRADRLHLGRRHLHGRSDRRAPTLLHDGYYPSFSPEGNRIVFAQYSADAGPFQIWVTAADGSNPVQIGRTEYLHPFAWSPDGTRVAFDSGTVQSGFSIVVLGADGSGATTLALDASQDTPPSWSPDGRKLAFTTTNDSDIAVVRADGSGRTLLIQDATKDVAPSWSPDGSQIAFFRGNFGQFFLYVIRPDGSGLHQLSQTPADTSVPPAWSPDGTHLVFGGTEPVGYSRLGPYYRNNVYVVGADGVGERRLTDSPSLDAGSSPIWAPDGRRIAFLSTRGYSSAYRQLFVMNADGTCETQVTTGSAEIMQPPWQTLPAVPVSDPLECAALSISGSPDVERAHPALDDSRVYVYRATIANNGNVTSDPLKFVTSDESPFSYVSAAASSGSCTIGARASCALPALPPGGTAEIVLRFNMFVSGTFPIEGEVEANGQTPDGDLSDNEDEQYRQFPFCEISTQRGSTLRAGDDDDDLICRTVGRDLIFAGGGNDRVFAGDGHDVVHGGTGADEIDGGGNTDFIYGAGGADKIHGGNGDDILIGGGGNDTLWGDAGGDYLKGGPGVDRFFGGYGNDLIDSRDGLAEHVYCGEGIDRVEADLRDIVSTDCEKVVRRPANSAQPRAPR